MHILATMYGAVFADATSEANAFFNSTGAGQAIAKLALRVAFVLLVVAFVLAIAKAAQGNRGGAMKGFFSLFAIAALLATPTVIGPILDFLGSLIGQAAEEGNNTVNSPGGGIGS